MKLSEIKGERVFDVIAEIIDPIVSIAEDEDASDLFKPKELPDGMEPWGFFLSRVKKSLPPLVKRHKGEICRIMASLNDVSVEDYTKELTIPKLFSDMTELLTDQEFTAFFK
jgi:hypothetical protein